MAPKRARARDAVTSRTSRVGSRRARLAPASHEETPSDMYRDMLSEAAASPAGDHEGQRPIKKRRLGKAPAAPVSEGFLTDDAIDSVKSVRQVVYDDSPSSEDSEADWEEVDFQKVSAATTSEILTSADKAVAKDISIEIRPQQATPKKRKASQRLPSSAVEKKMRLEIHKVHVCCLLAHVYVRNAWCSDEKIQSSMRSLLSKRTISYLNPDPNFSQFQRSRSFLDGLEQASVAFRPVFKTTARGLRRSNWVTGPIQSGKLNASKDEQQALDKEVFTKQAKRREGSRDVGSQLFCAMLRSVGVDTRLVCSLQPLSFTSAPSSQTPQKSTGMRYHANSAGELHPESADDSAVSVVSCPTSVNSDAELSAGSSGVPTRIKRLFGAAAKQVQHSLDLGKAPPAPAKRTKIKESHFPVYWVEAFNTAQQKWIPVDPLTTLTIDKAHKFEPPASDSLNDMSYVVAFDDEGSARDVTRRYAKAYNAKTRRHRVEVTKEGQRWWKKAMKLYRGALEDRDQVEDAEFARKEESEPMPRNVQDFKDHPYYALERHLRHNEVIHPKRVVGKLNTGKGADAVEQIYRRRDVQLVRTADKWYRLGRELKPNEQPLKYSARRRGGRHQRSPSADSAASDTDLGIGLYAGFQTAVYRPPPVEDGRVPRNAFGNLDLYVPSMIPPQGVHVLAPEARKAAQILDIDFAEAVTGFDFKGRRGTAVTKGVVVARDYGEAVEEVVRGLRFAATMEEERKRGLEALKLWKRFLVGLRVRERIMGYEVEGDSKDDYETEEKILKLEQEEEAMMEDGGFLQEQGQTVAKPTAGRALHETPTLLDPTDFGDERLNEPDKRLSEYEDAHMCVYSPWDPPWAPSSNSGTVRGLISTSNPNLSKSPNSNSKNKANIIDHQEEAGGFVRSNDDDNDAGGFFRSDDDEDQHPDPPVSPRTYDPERLRGDDTMNVTTKLGEADIADEGGGFMPDEDQAPEGGFLLPDGEVEGGGFCAEGEKGGGDIPHTSSLPEDANEVLADRGPEVAPRVKQATALEPAISAENGEDVRDAAEGDVESDSQSLLAEDPEDEDMEPEWLS